MMIECLASVMAGNALVAPSLEDPESGVAPVFNASVVAVDIAAFGDRDVILEDAERLRRAVLRLPAADGAEEVLLPGDRGRRLLAQRRTSGVPIVSGTWQKLLLLADRLAVNAVPV